MLGACASEPQTPQAVGAAVTAAPAATAKAADDANMELTKRAIGIGYRPRIRDGQRIYCRTYTPLGTRFPEEKCLSADAILDEIRRSDEAKDTMAKYGTCVGSSCGGG
jgi:hypothetical protein